MYLLIYLYILIYGDMEYMTYHYNCLIGIYSFIMICILCKVPENSAKGNFMLNLMQILMVLQIDHLSIYLVFYFTTERNYRNMVFRGYLNYNNCISGLSRLHLFLCKNNTQNRGHG